MCFFRIMLLLCFSIHYLQPKPAQVKSFPLCANIRNKSKRAKTLYPSRVHGPPYSRHRFVFKIEVLATGKFLAPVAKVSLFETLPFQRWAYIYINERTSFVQSSSDKMHHHRQRSVERCDKHVCDWGLWMGEGRLRILHAKLARCG